MHQRKPVNSKTPLLASERAEAPVLEVASVGLDTTNIIISILTVLLVVGMIVAVIIIGIFQVVGINGLRDIVNEEPLDALCQANCHPCSYPSDCPSLAFKDLRYLLQDGNSYIDFYTVCMLGRCFYYAQYFMPNTTNVTEAFGAGFIQTKLVKSDNTVSGTNIEETTIEDNDTQKTYGYYAPEEGRWEHTNTLCMGLLYPTQPAGIYIDCIKPKLISVSNSTYYDVVCVYTYDCFINTTTYILTQGSVTLPMLTL